MKHISSLLSIVLMCFTGLNRPPCIHIKYYYYYCSWSYLLYQLIAYYTLERTTQQTLWEYLGWTVLVFQNAALLEVRTSTKYTVPIHNSLAYPPNRSFTQPPESSRAMSYSPPSKCSRASSSCAECCWPLRPPSTRRDCRWHCSPGQSPRSSATATTSATWSTVCPVSWCSCGKFVLALR